MDEAALARSRLSGLAAELVTSGDITSPEWREIFERTWRHLYVPEFYLPAGDDWRHVDSAQPEDRPEWLRRVYSNTTLITQLTAVQHPDGARYLTYTSSSTLPGLMLRMVVDGQVEAIERICAWLDQWRQDSPAGPYWPYWITRAEMRAGCAGCPGTSAPARPSWCYGTTGLARAQQLAALAVRNVARQRTTEHSLSSALTSRAQLAATTDMSLCHGYAGLLHVTGRAAADAITPDVAACLPRLLDTIAPDGADPDQLAGSLLAPEVCDPGLLNGAVGIALALHAYHTGALALSGWDACLLIS